MATVKRNNQIKKKPQAEFTYSNLVLAKALKDRDFDVIEQMIHLFRHGALSDRDKASILEKLLPYLLPKLSSTEIKGDNLSTNVIQIIYKDEKITPSDDD